MNQTKIVKLLRLMKLLTGNVNRTIDQLAAEMGSTSRTIYRYIDNIRDAGFVVNKLHGNVYQMGKVVKGLTDFNKLIYFTEEEAFLTAKLIEGIDNNNVLKRDLQRKLASVYDSTSIANYIDNPANAANVEALAYAIKKQKQVILEGYQSANSDNVTDRLVEPFAFTSNMIDVWAYDIDNGDCRLFKVMRIHHVDVLDTDWAYVDKHVIKKPDVFRMSGPLDERITLELNTRSKALLLEEFPFAEKNLRREENKWFLTTTIHNLEGAGRFVIGLAADVHVLEGAKLIDYIRQYDKNYIQRL